MSTPSGERRAILLVLDGVGAGEAPDAARYGDAGSNTLGNLAEAVGGLHLPALESLGLGRVLQLRGVSARVDPLGAWGRMTPASAGKDSTTGHWELAGVHLARPFPTYPHGFPREVIEEFERRSGRRVIGNIPASGTEIIERFAAEQAATGAWIVYTSADSVFQIAAHEEVIPLRELYDGCALARQILVAPHDVARVIARPFAGSPGSYRRTAGRRDFALPPPEPTLLDALEEAGVQREGVGKVDDLFAGRGISSRHTADNSEGIAAILEWIRGPSSGLLFANLVDFDQRYGHRNDVAGFYRALQEFDAVVPEILRALGSNDLLIVTADHGNDPTTPSTDHSRERVPLLVVGRGVRPVDLGERATFSDVSATIGEWFGIDYRGCGRSFLREVMG
ncbi:MAG TPA: phosphopentomutase [Gemmatimonadaceae bacterium]|nr:phosphopentomutase [Gemmatimonadaceae bacterium]